MRVITGIARGRRLKTPESQSVRPTSDRVKEAIFSMIHYDLQEAVFADLFCGSGQMGIEALSRGAKKAYFVDSTREGQALTIENLKSVNLMEKANVILTDCGEYLKYCKEKFDIVFLDPPYKMGYPEKVLPLLENCMNDNGIIILETERQEAVPESIGSGKFELCKQTNYGIIKISVFKNKSYINE